MPIYLSKSEFFTLYIFFILLCMSERIIFTFFSSKNTRPTKYIRYRWTFFILFFTYVLIVASSITEYLFLGRVINLLISIFGMILFFIGVLLRRKSASGLYKNWSLQIEIKINHELITNGIYKFLKHPYCISVIFELIGICLIANAFYSLLLVFMIQIPLLLIRIALEEKILANYFGEDYRKYKRGKIF